MQDIALASRAAGKDAEKEELMAVIGRNGLNQTTSGIVQDPLRAVKQAKNGL
ncbi:hypothetical protein D521_1544 [beta proteobacterium CB]|nr:hypothetical protein D521_1544 [beta proteobacterium CB]